MLKRFFLIAIICSSIAFLVLSRTIPVKKIWREYTVLCVYSSVSEKTVLSVLSKCGITGVITLSSHTESTPKTMSPAHFRRENPLSMNYPEEIKKYFFDESQRFQLYYVPDGFDSELSEAAEIISASGACGVDKTFSYPIFVPIVCLLFFMFLLVSAENKLPFILFAIFPLLFSICIPSSINGAATCLLLYGCFLLQKLYAKQNAVCPGFHNVFLVLSLFFPILICLAVSPKNAALCASSSAGTLAAALMILHFKGKASVGLPRHFRVGSSSFSPVSIISTPYTSVVTREAADCLFLCAGAILLQIVFSIFPSERLSQTSGVKGLHLPSPSVSRGTDFLPDLRDYLNWSWEEMTFQYRPLWASVKDSGTGSSFKDGDVLEVPFYEMDGTKAVRLVAKRFVYGEPFLREMLSSIENSGQKRIELFLSIQSGNGIGLDTSHFSYSAISGGADSAQSPLLILFATVCIPLGMALYYIYRRRKQYANSI